MVSTRRPVLVYDGDCGVCTRCVQFVEQRLPVQPSIQAWQHADLPALGLTRAQAEHAVQWVEPNGAVSSGAVAVARLLLACGGAWSLLGRLLLTPPVSWLGAGLYRVVADNRSRLPGGTPACSMPAHLRPGAGKDR